MTLGSLIVSADEQNPVLDSSGTTGVVGQTVETDDDSTIENYWLFIVVTILLLAVWLCCFCFVSPTLRFGFLFFSFDRPAAMRHRERREGVIIVTDWLTGRGAFFRLFMYHRVEQLGTPSRVCRSRRD